MYTSKRLGRTIIIGFSWLAVTILALAFNPARLGFWQSAAAVLASGFVAVGAVVLTWITPRI